MLATMTDKPNLGKQPVNDTQHVVKGWFGS